MDFNLALIAEALELAGQLLEASQDLHEQLYDILSLSITAALAAIPVFVCVLLVTFLGRNWLPAWSRYALWTLVLVRLVLPVSIASPISVQIPWLAFLAAASDEKSPAHRWLLNISANSATDEFRANLSGVPVTAPLPTDAAPMPTVPVPSRGPEPHSLQTVVRQSLKVLFLAGTIAVAAIGLVSFRRMILWIRNSRECTDQDCLDLIDEGRRIFGIGASIKVLTVHQMKSAGTIDWFWPVILLPENFTALSSADKKTVVWHELARIRRVDSAFSILLAVAQTVQWWNPVFWWTRGRWLVERELACDQLARSRMNASEAAGFLHSLQSLKSEASKPSWSRLLADATGFVAFHDGQQALSSRIAAAARAPQFESRTRHWTACCVVALMSVATLTDAAKIPLKDSLIELPAGTLWQQADGPDARSPTEETRRYSLDRCIARLRLDDLGLNQDRAADELRSSIEQFFESANGLRWTGSENSKEAISKNSRCRLVDQTLEVRATSSQHERIAKILSDWSILSRGQICIEIRCIQTPMELVRLLPATGGRIIDSSQVEMSGDSAISMNRQLISVSRSERANYCPIPVFTQILNPNEAFGAVQRVCGDTRTSQIMAPKVTIFDGETATISDFRVRPFVTGLYTEAGSTKPQIFQVEEGSSFDVFALIDAGKIHLSVNIRTTEITDVKTRKLRLQPKEVLTQVPELRKFQLHCSAELKEQNTLLLAPLQRQENGHLTIYLITPRIIEIEDEEEPLGLPQN